MKLTGMMTALMAVGTMQAAGAAIMEQYRWKNRVLVLFAREEAPEVAAQRDHLLRFEPGLAERDMVIFAVIGKDRIQPIYGEAPPAEQAAALLSELKVDPGAPFTAVLVGLDGGVKWQEDRPVEQQELFKLIDSMPMRQRSS